MINCARENVKIFLWFGVGVRSISQEYMLHHHLITAHHRPSHHILVGDGFVSYICISFLFFVQYTLMSVIMPAMDKKDVGTNTVKVKIEWSGKKYIQMMVVSICNIFFYWSLLKVLILITIIRKASDFLMA